MAKRGKNKKAEFFIVASLIGVIVVFSFISIVGVKRMEKPIKVYDLGNNFKFETIDIIAKGKISNFDASPAQYLDNITRLFLAYGLTEDPRLELVYVYGNASEITVYNFADEQAVVNGQQSPITIPGGRKNISSTLSLGEIKARVIEETRDYERALNQIKSIITPVGTSVTVQLGNINQTFSLAQNEQFYLILRTKRENETFTAVQ